MPSLGFRITRAPPATGLGLQYSTSWFLKVCKRYSDLGFQIKVGENGLQNKALTTEEVRRSQAPGPLLRLLGSRPPSSRGDSGNSRSRGRRVEKDGRGRARPTCIRSALKCDLEPIPSSAWPEFFICKVVTTPPFCPQSAPGDRDKPPHPPDQRCCRPGALRTRSPGQGLRYRCGAGTGPAAVVEDTLMAASSLNFSLVALLVLSGVITSYIPGDWTTQQVPK